MAYEQSTYRSDVFSAYRSSFVTTQIPEFFAGTESDRVTGQPFASARQNYFGRVQYNYNDRYLAEFQGRYDGSQNFAQDRRFWFFRPFWLAGASPASRGLRAAQRAGRHSDSSTV